MIRLAVPEDIPQLIKIAQESVSAGHWTVRQYEEALGETRPLRTVLVVQDDAPEAHVIGFLVAAEIASEWELENIVVAACARRLGHADRLLGALLDRAREGEATSIYLEVRASNSKARALYEKWGFEVIGTRPGYYHNPAEDAILYRKNLVTAARENG